MTVAGVAAAVVAHQGGWDEVLLIAGPIVAIIGLLMLAKKRVDAAAGDDTADTADATAGATDDTTDHTATDDTAGATDADTDAVDTATADTATDDRATS